MPRRVPRLLQEVGLPGVESKRCEDLSKGMLQRVQFLGAVIHSRTCSSSMNRSADRIR